MRLVEFLILLLEAHSETLKKLAALFGEENLFQALELGGDSHPPSVHSGIQASWIVENPIQGTSPYLELEGAVRDFHLPSILEFHLWAYPYYRLLVEKPFPLDSRITEPAGPWLLEEAVQQSQVWIQSLPIEPSAKAQALYLAHTPWLKFRTTVLKRLGRRPLATVTK